LSYFNKYRHCLREPENHYFAQWKLTPEETLYAKMIAGALREYFGARTFERTGEESVANMHNAANFFFFSDRDEDIPPITLHWIAYNVQGLSGDDPQGWLSNVRRLVQNGEARKLLEFRF